MTDGPVRESRRRVRVIASLVGGLLAVAGIGSIVYGVTQEDPAPPQPPPAAAAGTPAERDAKTPAAQPDRSPKAKPQPTPETPSLELGYSEPTKVSIPSIDVSSSLEHLELDSEGAMEVPEDPDKAGWFTPRPPPGVVGTSVIAGHVTWDQEPVVFFDLGSLRKGDTVEVERKDGVTAVFTIDRIGQFPKAEFPTDAVYGQTSKPELRLITCGGVYDEESNRYLDNVIVWASMVSSHPTNA